jgi:hypothetical protein
MERNVDAYIDIENDSDNLLFYTSKVDQYIDDNNIIKDIYNKYPKLKFYDELQQEKEERKCFLDFLQEKTLIESILDKYNISIVDIIKLFYKRSSYIFNTATYLAKVRKILSDNGYRTEAKPI